MALPAEKVRYTYADYMTWGEDERMEIIDGEVFPMAAPSSIHQEISMEISRQFANYLEGKPCKVYAAPFDVRLFEKDGDALEDVDTVIEPDISVVCDKSRIDVRGCKGAPDLICRNPVAAIFAPGQACKTAPVSTGRSSGILDCRSRE